MKYILSLLALVLVSVQTYAVPAPTFPQTERRLKELGLTIEQQGKEGKIVERVARVIYDVATDLGTAGAHTLGVKLPANTLITRSYLYIVTQFVDAGAGTVALHCEDANNIKTATDITGTAAGGLIEGASTGSAATMVGAITAECEVTATVATADQTAGKLVAYIHYVTFE